MKEYGEASGQKVNLDKTSIVFGRNVHVEDKEAVCEVLRVHEQQGRGKYLGLPGYVGRRKREILGFVRDKNYGEYLEKVTGIFPGADHDGFAEWLVVN
nr:ribonuclease H [Ipomoea batatas]